MNDELDVLLNAVKRLNFYTTFIKERMDANDRAIVVEGLNGQKEAETLAEYYRSVGWTVVVTPAETPAGAFNFLFECRN